MRARAVVLLVLGALVLAAGCGGDDDSGSGDRDRQPGAVGGVTPSDYALRAERRCRSILSAARRTVVLELRARRAQSPSADRRFLRSYGDYLGTIGTQLDRLARLSAPGDPEYRRLRRALQAVTPRLTAILRRNARLLERTPDAATYARVRRSSERAGRTFPVALFPPAFAGAAPSCRILLDPSGGRRDRDPVPRGLSA